MGISGVCRRMGWRGIALEWYYRDLLRWWNQVNVIPTVDARSMGERISRVMAEARLAKYWLETDLEWSILLFVTTGSMMFMGMRTSLFVRFGVLRFNVRTQDSAIGTLLEEVMSSAQPTRFPVARINTKQASQTRHISTACFVHAVFRYASKSRFMVSNTHLITQTAWARRNNLSGTKRTIAKEAQQQQILYIC
jgi:hypothetical protein